MATLPPHETEQPTPHEGRDRSGTSMERLQLRVTGTGGIQTVPLPPIGTLVIGRAPGVEVHIKDGSISRRHAVLYLGRTIQVEDLGSSNGTRVCGRRIEAGIRVDVQSGDVMEFGKVLCLLEGGSSRERPARIWTHGYFEARLEDECVRAATSHTPFAVLRLRVDPDADAAFERDLLAALRPSDVVALYAPGEYEVLRVEPLVDEITSVVRELSARLEVGGRVLRVGAACHPFDGRSPHALLARASELLRQPITDPHDVKGAAFVVEDPAMVQLHGILTRVAAGTLSVLLLGETGVGKEIFAEQLHARSTRPAGPFLKINCAAFADALIESELFGHERGAFTGATVGKPGLLETAAGGTVFLDEVGELSPAMQAKLLRVIEERQARRVGGLKSLPIDVRIVAATNRDLEAEIAAGRFRSDLYFRLAGIALVIPPLRERVHEISPLAHRFASLASQQAGHEGAATVSPDAITMLRCYRWPGNIRELRNMMERAVLLAGGATITPEHLPVEKMGAVAPRSSVSNDVSARPSEPIPAIVPESLRVARGVVERQRIVEALDGCGGNQTKAAAALGISRRALVTKLGRYNLPRPRKRDTK